MFVIANKVIKLPSDIVFLKKFYWIKGSGAFKGTPGTPSSQSKFFHFHAIIGKRSQILGYHAPPPTREILNPPLVPFPDPTLVEVFL